MSELFTAFREWVPRYYSWNELVSTPSFHPHTTTLRISCPFHVEKTPSLRMWEGSKRFKCHGCSVEGDMVEYVALVLGVSLERHALLPKETV